MAGISMGTQLEAPEGFGPLEKGVTYHFLRSSPKACRVLLIHFAIRPAKEAIHKSAQRPKKMVTPTPLPVLTALERGEFETAILSKQIRHCEVQNTMPPWLLGLEGKNLLQLDGLRSKYVKTHADRVEEKVDYIYPLVREFDDILEAADPDFVLNMRARSCVPKQNETRLRLWFYTYMLFGMNRQALHYPTHRIGRWSRDTNTPQCKQGRPHKYLGKQHGFNTSKEMKEKIHRGWRRETGLGIQMTDIYIKVMKKDFGCSTRQITEGSQKRKVLWHPDGKPFPSTGAFVYHVLKEFGSDAVQLAMYGYVRVRSKLLPSIGPFTEYVWQLMQVTERDAYSVGDLARGLIEGNPLPPLYVVRLRDTASGLITGIGFSQGGERASAYRMALFCEAIPKSKFCELFGLAMEEWRWPSHGNSPRNIQDRGAGCTEDAFSRIVYYEPVVKESPPSHAGQSKAVIESTNPKTKTNDEAPGYFASSMRTFELVRREIFRVWKDNDTFHVRSRIPPDLADKVSRPTPLGVWVALDELGRNDAVEMTFEDAVRAYLSKAKATLSSDGVAFHGMHYRSDALDAVNGRRMVSGKQTIDVEVYVLDACVRHIWIDLHAQLIELDLQVAIPVGNEVLYMSLEELKQFEVFVDRQDSFHDEHRTAVTMEIYELFKQATGLDWDAGARKSGQPKRGGPAAMREAAEAKRAMGNGAPV